MKSYEYLGDDFQQAVDGTRENGGQVILPCSTVDPAVFVPDKENDSTTREAKQLCQTCPFIVECLKGALERQEQFGVWGGMSTRERNKILKQNKRETAA